MSPNDGGLMAIIQSQIEQVLNNVRDQRKEIADIQNKMATKDDLKDNKGVFNDKIEDLNKNIRIIDTKFDEINKRVSEIENSDRLNTDFIKSIRGGAKWFFGAIFLAALSAFASLIPMWWNNNVVHSNQPTPATYGQPNPQEAFPPIHIKIHSP